MSIRKGFLDDGFLMPCELLLPSKQLPPDVEGSRKFKTICASIADVGLIEPLSVGAADKQSGVRVLLDGHARLAALKKLGITQAPCLEAVDIESFTYNSKVNRLSSVQEHHMLRRAVQRGVSPDRLAAALAVNAEVLRRKVTLLDGICPEAVELIKDRQFSPMLTTILRKMRPDRQVTCVELMVASNALTLSYAKGLLYTSRPEDLVSGRQQRPKANVTAEQLARIEHEASNLQERYKAIEQEYGSNVLNLTVVCGYLNRLLSNQQVLAFLRKRHPDLVGQLERILASTSMQE